MSYAVKEIFYTLQGEGRQAGRPAVFCRFAGCNLWSGREADRTTAPCSFCDTDFVVLNGPGGGRFASADDLAEAILAAWEGDFDNCLVVLTGGEPLLQVDEALIAALHARGFQVAVETNGTLPAPTGLDWIAVSPKGSAPLAIRRGNELKLVFPQDNARPESCEHHELDQRLLQPKVGPAR
jgi:7-carboxy-7-deazaguanine synthase (Cx14CxxC type)